MRINQYIAKSGLCSRRKADVYIQEGRVYVDHIQADLFTKIGSNSLVTVDGHPLPKLQDHQDKLYLFYKPTHVLTSTQDIKQRKTLLSFLPNTHLMPIGRLDYLTEGLLLFTNNGHMARLFELPSSHIMRTYHVDVSGSLSDQWINRIKKGFIYKDKKDKHHKTIIYKPAILNIMTSHPSKHNHHTLEFQLYEGKNREIRNMCAGGGLIVKRLIRTGYGPYTIQHIKSGTMKERNASQCLKWLTEHIKDINS